MKLFVPKETDPAETRVPLIPIDTGKLVKLGVNVEVEAGIGESINISNEAYEKVGAEVSNERKTSLSKAEMVLRLSVADIKDVQYLSEGCIHVSHMDPFHNSKVIKELAAKKVSGISLEMIPRTSIAQKMDALSSQANLAGYVAVVLAAERLQMIFPMMMTAAGTISPARVLVIGVGIAGLQAIATAKRLGARVDAFDVRPEAREQILSLGAKPLIIDLGQTNKTRDGYAKQLTDQQLQTQRQAIAKQCALSDVVITTAKVFGRKAPLIVTNDMLDGMKPGSLVVDLAIEDGGNVEASELGKEIVRKGVTIIGWPLLERRVPVHASQMFSCNLYNLLEHFWDSDVGSFKLNREDEIIQSCLVTHDGEIICPITKAALR
jgi:NAD(P) transhydrogenase subunit alpha